MKKVEGTRAYNAGKGLAMMIIEMSQMFYQKRTQQKFFEGLLLTLYDRESILKENRE